jgi:hypothetical protein
MERNVDRLAPARLAMLAVVTCIEQQSKRRPDHVIIEPGGLVVTEESAIQRLADIEKPVACQGELGSEGLILRCSPLAGPTRAAWEMQLRHLDRPGTLIDVAANSSSDADEQRVLVESGRDSLLVRVEDVKTFFRDYVVWMNGFGIGTHEVGPSEASKGVCARMVFGCP